MNSHSKILWESEIADVFQTEARSLREPEPTSFPTPEQWFNHMTDAIVHQRTARSREAIAAQSLADGDWEQYLWFVPKNLRSRALWLIQDRLSDKDYWKLLGEIGFATSSRTAIRHFGSPFLASPGLSANA
jgi:hypothetical protein